MPLIYSLSKHGKSHTKFEKMKKSNWLNFYCCCLFAVGKKYISKEGVSTTCPMLFENVQQFMEYGMPMCPYIKNKMNLCYASCNKANRVLKAGQAVWATILFTGNLNITIRYFHSSLQIMSSPLFRVRMSLMMILQILAISIFSRALPTTINTYFS